MPEQTTQETSDSERCPKNPFGHSWQRIDQQGNRLQQRCRFCQQAREIHQPPSVLARQKRKMSNG